MSAVDMSVWGPDVSHYQGDVNWQKVAKAGASFAFIKATDGASYVDTKFAQNWHGVRTAPVSLIRGAYHYAHIENDPVIEAKHYVDTVKAAGGFHAGDFAILDAEDVCPASKKIGQAITAAWCAKWLAQVVALTGLPKNRVVIYTGMWWWTPRTGSSASCSDHPLWLSAYTNYPPNPAPFKGWAFWQYTDKRQVPGIGSCDASVWGADLGDIKHYSGLA